MVGLFYLATIYASLKYWAANTAKQRYLWLAAAILSCCAGMASKEIMVTAPVIVVLLDRTFLIGSFRRALRQSWPLYVGLAAGWVLLLLLNYDRPRSASAGFNLAISPLVYSYTQAKVLWMYIKLVVLAVAIVDSLPTGIFRNIRASVAVAVGNHRPRDQYARASVAAICCGFVGAWVLLILSPTLVVPIVTEVAAERRMYLPLARYYPLVCRRSLRAVAESWNQHNHGEYPQHGWRQTCPGQSLPRWPSPWHWPGAWSMYTASRGLSRCGYTLAK